MGKKCGTVGIMLPKSNGKMSLQDGNGSQEDGFQYAYISSVDFMAITRLTFAFHPFNRVHSIVTHAIKQFKSN